MTDQARDNSTGSKKKWQILLICLFITATTLFVYWKVGTYQFINCDDTAYVTSNQHVQKGISVQNIKWAFSL